MDNQRILVFVRKGNKVLSINKRGSKTIKAVALSSSRYKHCVVDSDYMTVGRCTLHLCRDEMLSYLLLFDPAVL